MEEVQLCGGFVAVRVEWKEEEIEPTIPRLMIVAAVELVIVERKVE